MAGLRVVGAALRLAEGARRRRIGEAGRWTGRPRGAIRLLLIRPDHIGDVLLAAPAGRLLQAARPGVEIDWMVGPWSADVVRRSGHTGRVHICEFPGFTRRPKRSPIEPYAVLMREARRLRRYEYDAAFVLRPDHWWGAMLAALAGVPWRFGFAVAECQPFLTDMLPPPRGHALEASQDLARLAVARLGGSVDASSGQGRAYLDPGFRTTEEERQRAACWLSRVESGGSGPLIVIHAGAGASLKNWATHRWAAVGRALQARIGARIVLTGGPDERDLATSIAADLVDSPLNLAGKTTLGELAAVLERCDLVLGGDSGPLHIAAAVGTPTVRIYGPTNTTFFAPWGDPGQQVALKAGLFCQPCGLLVNPPCGAMSEPACLQAIEVEQVVQAAVSVLGTIRPKQARAPAPVAPSPSDQDQHRGG